MNPEEMEEERRLAYVAITRAKKNLIVTHVRERMINGRTSSNALSRFIGEIPEELKDVSEDVVNTNELRQRMPRPPKVKPVNHFVEQTKKPVNTMAAIAKKVSETAPSDKLAAGDRVKHMTFGEGTVLSAKPMGSDILYEIAFDSAGTKKLMATYAKLKKI